MFWKLSSLDLPEAEDGPECVNDEPWGTVSTMNAGAPVFVPKYLEAFPDLPRSTQSFSKLASEALRVSGKSDRKPQFRELANMLGSQRAEIITQKQGDTPLLPAGFVTLQPATLRPRADSKVLAEGKDDVIKEGGKDDVVKEGEKDGRENEEQEQSTTRSSEPHFMTRITRNSRLSERWVELASGIAKKDEQEKKEEGGKRGPHTTASNAWHNILLAGMKGSSTHFELSGSASPRPRVAEVSSEVTPSHGTECSEKVRDLETEWWMALFKQDDECLRRCMQPSFVQLPLPDTVDTAGKHKPEALQEGWLRRFRGTTPLQIAAGMGHVSCMEVILSSGCCNFDFKDRRYKRSPLLFAAESGSFPAVRLLLKSGCTLDVSRDKSGETILHKAVRGDNASLVSWICSKVAKGVNLKNKKNETPLFLCNSRAVAMVLINNGANPYLLNDEGLDVACLAARRGKADLLSAVMYCNPGNYSSPSYYSGNGGMNKWQRGVTQVPTRPSSGVSDGYPASASGVKINPTPVATCRKNPMQLAIEHGHLNCVQLLCTLLPSKYYPPSGGSAVPDGVSSSGSVWGGGMTLEEVTGWSHLHYAIIHNHLHIVQELLQSQKDYAVTDYSLLQEDKQGACALVLAAVWGVEGLACLNTIVGECKRRKLPLLHPSYRNSRNESLLETFSRLKAAGKEGLTPHTLFTSSAGVEQEGDDEEERIATTDVQVAVATEVVTLLSLGVPLCETFLGTLMAPRGDSRACLLKPLADCEGMDSVCCFHMTERYILSDIRKPAFAPSLAARDSSTRGMDVMLLCDHNEAIPASSLALRELSPSLEAMIHFRQQQLDEQGQERGAVIVVPTKHLTPEQGRIIAHFSTTGDIETDQDRDCHRSISSSSDALVDEVETLSRLLPWVHEHLLIPNLGAAMQDRLLKCLCFRTAPLLLLVSLRFSTILPLLLPCAAKTVLVMLCTQGPAAFREEQGGEETNEGWKELCVEALLALARN